MSGRPGPLPRVKEPHLAGRWYPAAPDALARATRAMLDAAGAPRAGIVGLVVPHGTHQHSGAIAALGFAAAGPGVQRAVVLAPSHFAAFRGAALLPFAGYRTPLGEMRIDAAASAVLARSPLVRPNPAVFMREHALEIQLPFLQALAPACSLVPLLIGTLEAGDAAALAASLRALAEPGTLLVASSDLTHYGRRFDYLPVPASDAPTVAAAVRRLDEGALERIVARDADGFAAWVEETGATICGRGAIEVLLRALPAGSGGERLGYTTSLEVTGDYEHTVSYAAVAFAPAA